MEHVLLSAFHASNDEKFNRQRGESMRVIAGSARSLRLKSVDGLSTRPTTDKVKETLFNMIAAEVPESVFLDLFSGSGAIGIEALSRGARGAVFVENNHKAIKVLHENLKHTKLSDKAHVICRDFISALGLLEGAKKFDFIFMDPPYGKGLEKKALEYLAHSSIIHEQSLMIVESDLELSFDYLESLGFRVVKEKVYKGNKHTFIEKE